MGGQVKFDNYWIKNMLYSQFYGSGYLPNNSNMKMVKPIFWEQRLDDEYKQWIKGMEDSISKEELRGVKDE
jgi:hypothetical protein